MQYVNFDGQFVDIPLRRSQTLEGSSGILQRSEDAVSVDMESGKIFINVSDLISPKVNYETALGLAKALLIERIKDYKEKIGMPEIVIDLGENSSKEYVRDLTSQSFLNQIADQACVSVKAEECTIFHGENTKSTQGVYFTRVQDEQSIRARDLFFKQNPFGF